MNEEHSDLSLACEDGQQFDVHKLVLSACSPFFQVAAKLDAMTHPGMCQEMCLLCFTFSLDHHH